MQPPLRQAEALEGLAPPAASQALAPGPLTPPSLNEEWASLLGEEVPAPPPPPPPPARVHETAEPALTRTCHPWLQNQQVPRGDGCSPSDPHGHS